METLEQSSESPEADSDKVSSRWFYTSVWGLPGILAAAVVGVDQLTKWIVCRVWPVPASNFYEIIPDYFALVHWRNKGAAWGIFAEHTWILACMSLLAAVAMLVFFRRLAGKNKVTACTLGVLLGGIIGNMIDRMFFNDGVIDFLFFHYKSIWSWPAFNIADSAITCSVILLCISMFIEDLQASKRKKAGAGSENGNGN